MRNALGDSADNPRFVETLPRRGFRFLGPVEISEPRAVSESRGPGVPTSEVPESGVAKSRRSSAWKLGALVFVAVVIAALTFALSGKRPVLAVATFDNETGQPQYDRFTSGIADALIAHLGTLDVNRIGVIGNARTLRMPRSERDLNQIKSETGASFILLSQLQSREGSIRLITQLIRLDDDTHVWVKRFDWTDGNLDGLEAEVLTAVKFGVRMHVMEQKLTPAPSSTPSVGR